MGGLVALSPHLLWVAGMGYSEGLATALFALTMWAILCSLDDERFIVLGGLLAGLAYLARAVEPWLRDGDDVTLAGAGKYAVYAYVARPTALDVYVQGNELPGAAPG